MSERFEPFALPHDPERHCPVEYGLLDGFGGVSFLWHEWRDTGGYMKMYCIHCRQILPSRTA